MIDAMKARDIVKNEAFRKKLDTIGRAIEKAAYEGRDNVILHMMYGFFDNRVVDELINLGYVVDPFQDSDRRSALISWKE